MKSIVTCSRVNPTWIIVSSRSISLIISKALGQTIMKHPVIVCGLAAHQALCFCVHMQAIHT